MLNFYHLILKFYSAINAHYAIWQRRLLKTQGLAPLRTFIYLTYRCNCVCYFCNSQVPGKEEMTLNDVKHITSQLPRNSVITFSGGEVTLVRDFLKIIEASAKTHRVQIQTSGSSLGKDKDFIRKLIDYGVWVINFSIDTPNSQHDKIRGPTGLLQNITEAIKEIKIIRQKNRLIKPLVHVNTTILKESIPYLPEMVQYCIDLEVDSLSFGGLGNNIGIDSLVYTEGITKNKSYDNNDLVVFKHKMDVAIELAKKSKLNFRLAANVKEVYQALRKKEAATQDVLKENFDMSGYACHAPWSTLFIDPDGKARMCSEKSVAELGNIYKTSLRELWNNQDAKDFRKSIMSKKNLPQSCLKCCVIARE